MSRKWNPDNVAHYFQMSPPESITKAELQDRAGNVKTVDSANSFRLAMDVMGLLGLTTRPYEQNPALVISTCGNIDYAIAFKYGLRAYFKADAPYESIAIHINDDNIRDRYR